MSESFQNMKIRDKAVAYHYGCAHRVVSLSAVALVTLKDKMMDENV